MAGGDPPEGKAEPGGPSPAATTVGDTLAPTASDHPEPVPLPLVPSSFYDIEGEQGRGGIGVVLRAKDLRLGRRVAIKKLRATTASARERFEREMRFTARLQHPGVVPIHEAGCFAAGVPFYSMKLIEGSSLREQLEQAHTLDERLVLLPHVLAVAETIAYAHSQGVIHRDLKPENVVTGAFGETVVIDWGLAKALAEAHGAEPVVSSSPESLPGLTVAGQVMGTPAFMSPEQARGEAVDERADVWALGAVLYELVTGKAPYVGDSSDEVLRRVLAGPPAPVDELAPDTPPELMAIIVRSMARDPAARYANAGELAQDLRNFATGQLVGAHRYTLATLVARWAKRHRAAVTISGLSLLILLVVGAMAVRNVLAAERHAQAERAVALRERSDARRAQAESDGRARELMMAQARAMLSQDPTLSLAWLREYLKAGGDPKRARIVAGDAWTRGVARRVLRTGGMVALAEFLPDGERVVMATADGRLRVLDNRTGSLRDLGKTDGQAASIIVDRRGRVATCDAGGALRVWDVEAGTSVEIGKVCSQHSSLPSFVLDDQALIIGGIDEKMRLFDISSRAERPLPDVNISSFLGSPDGVRVLVILPGAAEVWNLENGERRRLDVRVEVETVSWSGDGSRVATKLEDGTIYVWTKTGERVAVLKGGLLGPMAFSPDARDIVAGGNDGTLRHWNVSTGHMREFWRQKSAIQDVQFLPDGMRLVTLSNEHDVQIIRLDDSDMRYLGGAKLGGGSVALSRDGARVVSGAVSRLWELDDGPPRVLQPDVSSERTAATLSLDGKRAALVGDEGEVFVVDIESGARTRLGKIDVAPASHMSSPASRDPRLAISPDGRELAASGADGTIHLFSLVGGTPQELHGHVDAVFGLAFTPDSHTLFSGGQDGTVRAWDLGTGAGTVLGNPGQPIRSLALSRSGRWLASGDKAGGIRVWDLRSGQLHRSLSGHTSLVLALAFSPDESQLASGSYDGSARVWSVASGEGRVLVENTGFVAVVKYSPDGRTLAIGGADTALRLYDLATGAVRVLAGHSGWVLDVDFSPDGTRVATASVDESARLWDLATGESRAIPQHTAANYVRFSPDGKRIVSGGHNLRTWSDDLPWDAAGLLAWIDAHTDEVAPSLMP